MPELPVLSETVLDRLERERDTIARDLSNAVRGEVRFGAHDRGLYATDASIYQVEPLGVVIPESVDDAVAAVKFCAGRGIPMLPRGGGTSLAGQCVNRAVVIDMSARCRGVLDVNAEGRWCEALAGTTIDELNRHLQPTGLLFAPDPSTVRQANVGGCIGNNAAGTRSIRYGRTAENVLAVDAVLASGMRVRFERGGATRDPVVRRITAEVIDVVRRHEALIRDRFPRTLRRNAGYALDMILAQLDEPGTALDNVDLSALLCGSEGTLALTAGARLRLHSIPTHRALAVIGYSSVDEAIAMVPALLEARPGRPPGAVELLDDLVLTLARENLEYRRYVDLMPQPDGRSPNAVLYVELLESDAEALASAEAAVRRVAGASPIEVHHEPTAMAQALKLRQAGEPLLHAMPGERKPLGFVEDNAVPVEHLGEFVRRFRDICASHGTTAAFYAHASVGVLHVRPLLDLRSNSDREAAVSIATAVADLAQSLGGVMSGEHGDGRARGPLLERFFGPELMSAFREIKAIFDPDHLLNPGNIVEPAAPSSIVETTRVRPAAKDVEMPPVRTYFEFRDQGGFGHAIERCNGAGVCRKTSGGTMCPSYLGTMDERHSTRGRGNALRLAVTGQFGTPGTPVWNDPETGKTLELCLSCKACKAECPSNVDLARLKAEYTAQSYDARGGAPRSARAFGAIRSLNRLGAMAPRLSNAMARVAPLRAILNRTLGISPERSLPELSAPLPKVWTIRQASSDLRPAVLLFGDCFSMYNESSVGAAAARLLEAFGYRPVLLDAGCCGRAMISTGLLPAAIRSMERSVPILIKAVEHHSARAVLVLEPSCLSSITDDWLDLRADVPLADRERIADMAFLVDDFLAQQWDRHPIRPEFEAPEGPVALHTHCHQDALLGSDSSASLLRRALGDNSVRVLDTGCCGMAGSFGYIDRNYDLSMRIGELSVFPAVRGCDARTEVLATGTSCRHQIKDGTGRVAEHPVAYLARRLKPGGARAAEEAAPLFPR